MRKLILTYTGFILIQFSFAQQSLFNVPSSDLTNGGKPFFQQQFNLTKSQAQLNATFDWGIGKQMEVGFNVLSLNLNTTGQGSTLSTNSDKSNPPVYPLFAVNFQKAVVISRHFKIALGSQTGISKKADLADFTYFNMVTALPKTHSKIITGFYYGSNTFLGMEKRNPAIPAMDPVGFQLGIEEQLIPDKFSIIFETISGKHSLGESSAGMAYFMNQDWIISGAYQISNHASTSQNAVVMELTYCPSSKVHLRLFKHGHKIPT